MAWRGHAIVLAGAGGIGTSRLIAALVAHGATLLADGELAIDALGRVRHACTSPADAAPADVALIVATRYQPDATWAPVARYGARAVLALLDRAAACSGAPRRQAFLAAQLARRVSMLSGPRPEAARVAPQLLAWLDDLIDGHAPAAPQGHSVAPAPAVLATEAAGTATPDEERALLRQQPAIVLLHWHGRFGNRMHQYAYGATYAQRTGRRLWLPSQWEGTRLFAAQPHRVLPPGRLRATLNRSRDQFERPERRLVALREAVPEAVLIRPTAPGQAWAAHDGTVAVDDVCAYHPDIFAGMSAASLRALFTFSDAVRRLDLYQRLSDRQGTYDIAHLRRDDISNVRYNQTHVQGYSVISKRSYEAAFARYGFDPAAIEWVSDDYSGRWHADRPPRPRGGWRYPIGSEPLPEVLFDWLEDFLRLYFARTIFRANSSFSWWAAFLAPQARVFSPVLTRRHIYGVDGLEEIDVEFVEGNHPHWMYGNADIRIPS